MIDEYNFKTLRDTEEIWYYDENNGIFKPNAEPIIKARLEKDFGHPDPYDKKAKALTRHKVNEYIGQIQRRTQINRSDFNPDIVWLAVENCMVNLMTGEIQPFDPRFMSTNKIPVNYDLGYPTGICSDFFRLVENERKIMRFLTDIMNHDDVKLFLDFLAYCLWREYKYAYWLMLHGAGYNGKSILLNLIERFLGRDNVAGETLDRLIHRDFAVANIFQKMVNVDADVSADLVFNNTGIIKKLTGNDLHTGEFKFRTPFKFTNYAKLIFSCNRLPANYDDTDAFYRRILIISFTQQFFGDKDDPNKIDKICTDKEFTELLHELLPRLRRILKNGFRKVTDESLAENADKFLRDSDPVTYFIDRALEVDYNSKITKAEMYDWYKYFCQIEGLSIESPQSVSRKVTEKLGHPNHTRVNGMQVYYWKSIKRLDWRLREKEENETLTNYESIEEAFKNER